MFDLFDITEFVITEFDCITIWQVRKELFCLAQESDPQKMKERQSLQGCQIDTNEVTTPTVWLNKTFKYGNPDIHVVYTILYLF